MNPHNKTRRIIMLNGPKRSGKDTAAQVILNVLKDHNLQGHELKVSEPLKDAFHALHGFRGVPHDYFESRKEEKMAELGGLSPREGYIDLSENYVKPKYGADHFGKVAVTRVNLLPLGVIVVSDCGFDAEVAHMSAAFGEENVMLLRLFRPNFEFCHNPEDPRFDSRDYVTHTMDDGDIQNDGTLEDFKETVREEAEWILRDHWKIA